MKTKVLVLSLISTAALLRSGGAFAQANTSLSNLTSPTAINQSLLYNADNTYSEGSSTDALVNVYTYGVTGSSSGAFTLSTPNVSGSNNASAINITAGSSSGTGGGGAITLTAGGGTYGGSSIYMQGGGVAPGGIVFQGANTDFIFSTGHIETSNGTSPSLGTCGTGGSIAATDNNGRITVGTGTSACTVDFGFAWDVTPTCVASDEKAAVALKVIPTSTTLTISASANFAAGTVLDYICMGAQ